MDVMTKRAGVAVLLTFGLLMSAGPSDAAVPKPHCGVNTHRAGPTATIDDNTMEGVANSTTIGARAEMDLLPLTDGFAMYHEKRWQQTTTGTGVPWQTDTAYVQTLTTTRNGQRIPLFGDVLDYAQANGTKLQLELHHWADAWTPELAQQVVDEIRARGLVGQVWLTGTNGAMQALAQIAPELTVVWRVDNDETPSPDYIAKRSVEVLAIGTGRTTANVTLWRSWGVRVQGRQTTPTEFTRAYRIGLHTVQTNRPLLWLTFCGSQ